MTRLAKEPCLEARGGVLEAAGQTYEKRLHGQEWKEAWAALPQRDRARWLPAKELESLPPAEQARWDPAAADADAGAGSGAGAGAGAGQAGAKRARGGGGDEVTDKAGRQEPVFRITLGSAGK